MKLTERQYIDLMELGTVVALRNIITQFCVANSSVIKENEAKLVFGKIYEWEEKLRAKIKVK